MDSYIFLILGMAVVTYIPRVIPFYILSGSKLRSSILRFLSLIPCTALGALIIPGVFYSMPKAPHAALSGFAFAIVYSWFRGGMIVSILGAIAIAFLLSFI